MIWKTRTSPTFDDPFGLPNLPPVPDGLYIPGKPDSDIFYCIIEPSHGPPTVVFNTISAAKREAVRLARNNPGRRFYIMRSMTAVEAAEAPVNLTPL